MVPESRIASRKRGLVVAIVWGAFAFGAVYPWAYWPLEASAVAIFALTLFRQRGGRSSRSHSRFSLALIATAITAQLIPVGLERLGAWSPETMRALGDLNLAVAAHAVEYHPFSIAPERTTLAFFLFVADALLMFACARLFSARGARGFVEALTLIGLFLALDGVIQQPLWNGK